MKLNKKEIAKSWGLELNDEEFIIRIAREEKLNKEMERRYKK